MDKSLYANPRHDARLRYGVGCLAVSLCLGLICAGSASAQGWSGPGPGGVSYTSPGGLQFRGGVPAAPYQPFTPPAAINYGPPQQVTGQTFYPGQQTTPYYSHGPYSVQSYGPGGYVGGPGLTATSYTGTDSNGNPSFDFTAMSADVQSRLISIIGQVMPLAITILIPTVGIMLVVTILKLVNR